MCVGPSIQVVQATFPHTQSLTATNKGGAHNHGLHDMLCCCSKCWILLFKQDNILVKENVQHYAETCELYTSIEFAGSRLGKDCLPNTRTMYAVVEKERNPTGAEFPSTYMASSLIAGSYTYILKSTCQ